MGNAGTRLALLHVEEEHIPHAAEPASSRTQARLAIPFFIWLGLCGSILLSICSIGGGSLPVLDNPYASFPFGFNFGASMARIPDVCAVGVMFGVALMMIAWVGLAPYVGIHIPGVPTRNTHIFSKKIIFITAIIWTIPFFFAAPVFSQDIYSYLAQGEITARHLDPYSGGPIDLLGTDNNLARSVPNTWAHSPAPYGPVATGLAALISVITHNALIPAVTFHRLLSAISIAVIGLCIAPLARRFHMDTRQAYWFIILNPLVTLHLIAGIHNDSIMIAMVFVGFICAYRATDNIYAGKYLRALGWILLSCVSISIGGLVKIPAFLALGFLTTGIARAFLLRHKASGSFLSAPFSFLQTILSLGIAGILCAVFSLATLAVLSLGSGLGFGWVFVQGGASDVVSWRAIITQLGQLANVILLLSGAGNHAASAIFIARLFGYLLIIICIIRCLWASFTHTLSMFPGYAVAMTFTVFLFPVIHPWYLLWSFVPLVLYANRRFTRTLIIAITIFMGLSALPRSVNFGVSLTLSIYLLSFSCAILFSILSYRIYKRYNDRRKNLAV